MSKQTIRGILMDIDNTIYPYAPCHHAGMLKASQLFQDAAGLSETEFDTLFHEARQQIKHGLADTAAAHSRLLYFQRLCEMASIAPLPLAPQASNFYWAEFIQQMRLRQGFLAFLKQIQGYPLAFVTDLSADIQFQKIESLGLSHYPWILVTSEEAGRDKPHPNIFDLALEKLKLSAADVCMIGDDYAKDIQGALAYGIPQAFWMTEHENDTDPAHSGITVVRDFTRLMDYFAEHIDG